jgi:hypothetical protein
MKSEWKKFNIKAKTYILNIAKQGAAWGGVRNADSDSRLPINRQPISVKHYPSFYFGGRKSVF